MINLYERMSIGCYKEIELEFNGKNRLETLEEILERFKVNAAHSLATFISIVANGIAFEMVDKSEDPPKWFFLESKGHYVDSKTYKETINSMKGVA